MPLYEYEREDGTKFEVMQKLADSPLETCPETGQKVRRLISAVPSHFKGDGFYITDYKTTTKSTKHEKYKDKAETPTSTDK
jgi:putative FmdB family regulatory protein